jgi:hypothetical protein
LKLQLDLRFALSKATQVTTVLPRTKFDPEAGEQEEFLMPDPSVAVCVNDTAIDEAPFGFTLMLAGHVSVGGTLSST